MQQTTAIPVEDRTLMGDVKLVRASVTDTVVYGTSTVATGMQTLNELLVASLRMSESNTRLVTLRTLGKEAAELEKIQSKYPNLDISNVYPHLVPVERSEEQASEENTA